MIVHSFLFMPRQLMRCDSDNKKKYYKNKFFNVQKSSDSLFFAAPFLHFAVSSLSFSFGRSPRRMTGISVH